MHKRSADLPPQVGVLVGYEGNEDTARAIGMQIAAMRPEYLTREEVPADVVANERHIAEATAREEGKPEAALPKIIEGRVNGFFKDRVLLEQSVGPGQQEEREGLRRRERDGRHRLRPDRDRRLTRSRRTCDAPGMDHLPGASCICGRAESAP